MNGTHGTHEPGHGERVVMYALRTLPEEEVRAFEAHLATCADCRRELALLRPVIGAFAAWPADLLHPPTSLWDRLAQRVAAESGEEPLLSPQAQPEEPEWAEVASGISCKLLATDTARNRVSMLVRLAPGTDYPPHRHAGLEELHLLDGELMIDDRKLYPGDYNRAELGTVDSRVWSETGCTCLLIACTQDEIR